MLRLIFFVICE